MQNVSKKAQDIYDLIMNERCQAPVQDLFSKGIYKMMEELFDEIEAIEQRKCKSCKYWNYQFTYSMYESCTFGLIEHSYEGSSFSCSKWEAK